MDDNEDTTPLPPAEAGRESGTPDPDADTLEMAAAEAASGRGDEELTDTPEIPAIDGAIDGGVIDGGAIDGGALAEDTDDASASAREPVGEAGPDDGIAQADAPSDERGREDEPRDATDAHDAPPIRRLVRSADERLIGGVAGGIAEYLRVDVSIVRLGFVLLCFLGGLGAVIYGAAWLLMPETSAVAVAGRLEGSRWRRLIVPVGGAIVALAAIRLLVAGPFFGGGIRGRASLGWLLLLAAVVLIFGRPARRGRSGWSILRRVLLVPVLLVVLLVSSALFAEWLTGVPLRGGIGSRDFHPASLRELQPTYRVAVGELTLDLTRIRFGSAPVDVQASVGIGHLSIEVPAGVEVSVDAHAGIGDVTYGPDGPASFEAGTSATGPLLVISAADGIGEVHLERVQSASSGDATSAAQRAPAPPGAKLAPNAP